MPDIMDLVAGVVEQDIHDGKPAWACGPFPRDNAEYWRWHGVGRIRGLNPPSELDRLMPGRIGRMAAILERYPPGESG